MKEIVEKYGFTKTDKNLWGHWDDYLLKYINPEYGYFLYATLHLPKYPGKQLEYNFSKIILHRNYNRDTFQQNIKDKESYLIYEGLIENEEDLKFLLKKLAVLSNDNTITHT